MKFSLKEAKGQKTITVDVTNSYGAGGKIYLSARRVEEILREKYNLEDYIMVESVDVLSNFAGVRTADYKFVKNSKEKLKRERSDVKRVAKSLSQKKATQKNK